jgi:hypothetical protein
MEEEKSFGNGDQENSKVKKVGIKLGKKNTHRKKDSGNSNEIQNGSIIHNFESK